MGGRRKFRFSDIMPNSWFYKLRDMRRAGGRSGAGGGASVMHQQSSSSWGAMVSAQYAASPRRGTVPSIQHRASYYYTSRDRELQAPPEPPQPRAATEVRHRQLVPEVQSTPRSSRRRHRGGPVGVGTARELAPVAEAPTPPVRRRDKYVGRDGGVDVGKPRRTAVTEPSTHSLSGRMIASDTDIIFDLCAEDMPQRALRPIVTRPARREVDRYESQERHVVRHAAMTPRASSASEHGSQSNPRRSSVSSGSGLRLKTRANSPRLACTCRKGRPTTPATTPVAPPRRTRPAPPPPPPQPPPPPPRDEGVPVVKMTADPRREFRQSMMNMIAENGIRDADGLEDLLANYLCLNAVQHHDLIVEVFEEIWMSLARANQ